MRGLLLVSGLGRCGTSLLMQMLHAGGFPIFDPHRSQWPAFEHPANLVRFDSIAPWASGAIKWLDPQEWRPPAAARASVYLRRDKKDQADSQIKWITTMMGGRDPNVDRDQFAAMLADDEPRAIAALRARGPVFEASFGDLLRDARPLLTKLAHHFTVQMDIKRAVSVVRQRPVTCLPDLLERQLISEGAP